VQPGGDLCIARQGVVQGMGSGTLFVRYCGRAGPQRHGHQQQQHESRLTSILKTIFAGYASADSELALSIRFEGVGWHKCVTSWAQCVSALEILAAHHSIGDDDDDDAGWTIGLQMTMMILRVASRGNADR
jgi:hypothetical protein